MSGEAESVVNRRSADAVSGEIATRAKRGVGRLKAFTIEGDDTVGTSSGSYSKKLEPDDNVLNEYLDSGKLVRRPLDITFLSELGEYSATLSESVQVMEVNVDGFGHKIVKLREDLEGNDVDEEFARLTNFFRYAYLDGSFVAFRRRLRQDVEFTGNAYFEVLRNPVTGAIDGFEHLPSRDMWLGRLEKKRSSVEIKRLFLQSDGTYKLDTIIVQKRFRAAFQSQDGGSTGVWFKEFGDPRDIDIETGEVSTKPLSEDKKANEYIHLKIYCARSPYGLPRYVSQLLTIFGERAAEEINYTTLKGNNIPSMLLLVANGSLTKGTVDRLKEFTTELKAGKNDYSRILVVEAEPTDEDDSDSTNVRIKAQPLKEAQQRDELYQNYSKNNERKIRQIWRLATLYYGSGESYNRACYDEHTETLTDSGWKRLGEFQKHDKIAAYDHEKGCIEFVIPDELFVYTVDEELLHFKNRCSDIMVTEDHTMLVRSCDSNDFSVHESQSIPWNRYVLKTTASSFNGEEIVEFDVGKSKQCREQSKHEHVPFSGDVFIEFLGYWISEGSLLQTDHHASPYVITLSQHQGSSADKIRNCLQSMGIDFSESVDKSEICRWHISHRCLRDWLLENCGGKSSEMVLPKFVWGLSSRQQRILFDALVLGDGHLDERPGRTSGYYSSTSKALCDDINGLATLLGYRASVSLHYAAFGNRVDCWRVTFSKRGDVGFLAAPQRVHYQGRVYCFSVPDYGFFVTRRNGKVAIQGNTANTVRKITEEQVFSPERQEFDEFINTVIMPELDAMYHVYQSNTPNVTNDEDLIKVLQVAEKTGAMTPRLARRIIEDIINKPLGTFEREGNVNPDRPFTLTVAEEVKNKAAVSTPTQVAPESVAAVKSNSAIDDLLALRRKVVAEVLNPRNVHES